MNELKEIAPYDPEEFLEAIDRLAQSPLLPKLTQTYFRNVSTDSFSSLLRSIKDVYSFQKEVISTTINSALEQSSHGLTISGLESLSRDKCYLFISNHRDIICDPALLTNSLFLAGFPTPKICLGDNLLTNPIVIDLVKMNKGVTVKRNLSTRELFKWSQVLSLFIRRQIEENIDSVWIAQREGRAKDGNDLTHPGVVKMLTLTSDLSFAQQIKAFGIVPVAVSYEFDPCDYLKAKELYLTDKNGSYQKAPHEDTLSILTGIRGHKGRIHIAVGKQIPHSLIDQTATLPKRDQVRVIVEAIDQQIHQNYRNWPSNYIAYDLLNHSNDKKNHYTEEEKLFFLSRMKTQLDLLEMSPEERENLEHFFLLGYANPVKNQ
jgi:hypothetical protein